MKWRDIIQQGNRNIIVQSVYVYNRAKGKCRAPGRSEKHVTNPAAKRPRI